MNSLKNQNILITGAFGFIGKAVLRKIFLNADRPNRVIGLDILSESPDLIQSLRDEIGEFPEYFEYKKMDVRSPEIENVLKNNHITSVVHLASIMNPIGKMSRETQHDIDIGGTKNLLDACLKAKTDYIIVTSSGAAYGYYKNNPEWIVETDEIRGNEEFAYSAHKREVEELLSKYRDDSPHLKQLILRPGTILGKNVNNQITDLFKKSVIIGIAGSKTPFVFIEDEDVSTIILQGLITKKDGIYNLAGDGAIPLREIAARINKIYLPIPAIVIKSILWFLQKLHLTQYGPDQVNFLRYRPVLSNRNLKEKFGYVPKRSSSEVLDFYLENNLVSK
ncbi:SDR family oxidoreductase [Leptospira stimsonii]|uniref:SDR family oxidoreductase n=1 Tax=Leptospira stimsonii TaxID=2202203 RepID=A0ABY2MXR7_9LEPT|nr:SDR family oxidoreductase [Leptospira stimsonii]TGK19060.1 SDR family oxidoreductase [Leptospira stimsonii]TGM11042.1 SDR family oxidoreductase [Leptospira stimsonii]